MYPFLNCSLMNSCTSSLFFLDNRYIFPFLVQTFPLSQSHNLTSSLLAFSHSASFQTHESTCGILLVPTFLFLFLTFLLLLLYLPFFCHIFHLHCPLFFWLFLLLLFFIFLLLLLFSFNFFFFFLLLFLLFLLF